MVSRFLYSNSYYYNYYFYYHSYFLTADLFFIARQSYRANYLQHFKAKFDQHFFP